MKVFTAVILGIWIVCGGPIGSRADTGTPTQDAVVENSTPIEASVRLAGRWRVAETTDEKKQRLKAIDEVTDHLGRFQRGKARSRLAERTSPPSSLMIEVTDSKVAIASGDRRLELELGGSPIKVTGSEGSTRMSAKMVGERLVVLSRGGKGERTVAYQAGGNDLSMEVTMKGDKLSDPLTYVTTYARMK